MIGKTVRAGMSALVVVMLVSACSQDTPDSEYMSRAAGYVSEQDYPSAAIELKNTIRQSPDNMQARLLLGSVYFEMGDMPSAEKELQKVRQSITPVDDDTLVPLLVKVWAKLGRNEQALNIDTEGLSQESVASVLATQAVIHMSRLEVEEADGKVGQARALSPDSTVVLNAQARLRYFHRDYRGADALLEEFHKREPDDASMWALHGDVRRMMEDYDQADKYYSKAIALNGTPTGLDYRMRRAFLRISQQQFDAAQEDISALLKSIPQQAQVNYGQGLIYFYNKQYKEAISSFVVAESDKFRFPQVLMYLGLAYYEEGNIERAYAYAQDFYAIEVNNPTANKLLSTLWVVKGKFVEAEQLVRSVIENYPNDIEALNILANALGSQNRVDEAIEVLAEVVALDPRSPRAQVRLSVGYTRAGRSDEAFEQVQNAIKLDPEFGQADMVLVLTHLRENDFEGALKAVQSYQSRNPGDTEPLLLLGRVYMEMGNVDAAHQAFEDVLELEPGNPSASHKLASLAIVDNDIPAARAYYEAVLKEHPHFLSTLTALAFLAGTEKNTDDMVSFLDEAIDAHPHALQPKVILARYYLGIGRADKVPVTLSGLSEGESKMPLVLRLMGRSQLAEKKYSDARYSLQLLVDQQGELASAEDHQLLGMAYQGLGDKSKMKFQMERALALGSNSVEVHLALANSAFSRADAKALERHLEAIAELSPDDVRLQRLEAAYARVKGDEGRALALFEHIFSTEPSTVNMLNLERQYEVVGKQEDALRLLQNWVKNNPTDNAARMALAGYHLAHNDNKSMVEEYTALLASDQNNIIALNNLAWSLKDKNPKLALQYAERAAGMAASSLAIKDTLAVVQSANGLVNESRKSIRQVLKEAPDNPTYLYHSALIAREAGDQAEALAVLQNLVKRDEKFPEREDAVELLKFLSAD